MRTGWAVPVRFVDPLVIGATNSKIPERSRSFHSGTDMAPWYPGATPTGAFGARWVAKDNNDAVYAWLNAINNAEFRHFTQYGQPLGHDKPLALD